MTPHNRVLLVVGGAAIAVCFLTAGIYVETSLANATLQAEQVAADRAAALGDQLTGEVDEQHSALGDYLLSGDPRPLARYRQAVVDEGITIAAIQAQIGMPVPIARCVSVSRTS
jgi:CHASE3 domain sensor protein